MAPKNKAKQKPGSMRSRQQAKLNSQRAQKSPIEPAPRTGPRRQLPQSSQGQNRVGNSSQPWGERQGSGQDVRRVRVNTDRPQLPPAREAMADPGNRPQLPPGRSGPGTSRTEPTRREMAENRARQAAQGSRSSEVRTARGRGTSRLTPEGMFAGPRVGAGTNKVIGALTIASMMQGAAKDAANPEFWKGKSKELRKRYNMKDTPENKGSTATNGRYVPGKEQSKFTDTEAAKPAEKQPARPVRSASQQPTTAVRNPSPKDKASTPSKPAPKASETYRDGGKGLYQGSKEYRDKVGGSGNPLLNRFRKEMGLDQATGQRADAPTVAKEAPKQEPKAASKSGGEGVKDSLKIDQAATKADSSKYFNQASTDKMPKSETAEQRRKRERMLAARKSGLA